MADNPKPPKSVYPGNKERYELCVALVHSKDVNGKPKLITVLYDDDKIDLAGGEEFVTLYLPLSVLRKK